MERLSCFFSEDGEVRGGVSRGLGRLWPSQFARAFGQARLINSLMISNSSFDLLCPSRTTIRPSLALSSPSPRHRVSSPGRPIAIFLSSGINDRCSGASHAEDPCAASTERVLGHSAVAE